MVRCPWMPGSRIMAGFVLHRGDLSWFNRSISSFVTILGVKVRVRVEVEVEVRRVKGDEVDEGEDRDVLCS